MFNPIKTQLLSCAELCKNLGKVDTCEMLIPQKIEDGFFINFRGKKIGKAHDGENVIFTHNYEKPSRFTTKFYEGIVKPVNDYFALESSGDEAPIEEPTKDEGGDEAPIEEPTKDEGGKEEEEVTIARQIEILIGKGKFKKAKKLLTEDVVGYKTFKKQIKKGLK